VNATDYGTSGEKRPNGSNWKVTGADSIEIYAFVAENGTAERMPSAAKRSIRTFAGPSTT
jgi:hypothetical protein